MSKKPFSEYMNRRFVEVNKEKRRAENNEHKQINEHVSK